jgi:hypothetical protein
MKHGERQWVSDFCSVAKNFVFMESTLMYLCKLIVLYVICVTLSQNTTCLILQCTRKWMMRWKNIVTQMYLSTLHLYDRPMKVPSTPWITHRYVTWKPISVVDSSSSDQETHYYGTHPHLVLIVSWFSSANMYTIYLSKLCFENIFLTQVVCYMKISRPECYIIVQFTFAEECYISCQSNCS